MPVAYCFLAGAVAMIAVSLATGELLSVIEESGPISWSPLRSGTWGPKEGALGSRTGCWPAICVMSWCVAT